MRNAHRFVNVLSVHNFYVQKEVTEMANCHHRRGPLLPLAFAVCLPFFIAIAAPFLGSCLRGLISRPLLQPSCSHHRLQNLQERKDDPFLFRPGAASLRGRRPSQEDRILCAPHLRVRHPGLDVSGIDLSLYAVFDGHLGDAASDFAARSIRDSFLRRTASRLMADSSSRNTSLLADDHLPWIEASLLAAIADIDLAFGNFSVAHSIKSGSTACVALQVRDQILVANVGDSKAFLCSSCGGLKHRSNEHHNVGALRSYQRHRRRVPRNLEEAILSSQSEGLCVQKLSSDHRPDRPDERIRIEASGGFVTNESSPRVNGQLAVSRAIGDIDLQKFGVIAEPELSGWQQVSEKDKFLILASDGIFEKLSPQEVCNVLHALGSGQDLKSIMDHLEEEPIAVIALPGVSPSKASSGEEGADMLRSSSSSLRSSSAHIGTVDACQGDKSYGKTSTLPFLQDASAIAQIMAQILVEVAYRAGSLDNLSVILVPLKAAMR